MTIFRFSLAPALLALVSGCHSQTVDDQARSQIGALKGEVGELQGRLKAEEERSKRFAELVAAQVNRGAVERSAENEAKPSPMQNFLEATQKEDQDRRLKALEQDAFLRKQGVAR